MPKSGLGILMQFFKALSNENRLRMLAALADKERGVEELATMINVKAPTISHHLRVLKELGVVSMRKQGNDHLYRLDSDGLNDMARRVFESASPENVADLGEGVEYESWERKVLNNFVDGERIEEIPAGYKKRLVILKWLADFFEEGKRYAEREVNELISQHHPDFSTLRRELVDHGFMHRQRGVYWRIPWTMPDLSEGT